MKVAVTGAAGFIGRHVLNELTGHAVSVTAVVRNATAAAALPCSHVIELDIANAPDDAFAALGRPDTLIHLAWGGLPNYRSLHHFEQELPTQYRFLRSLVASGLNNLHVVGTCFEYGMQSGPLSEDHPALPSNPYGFAKDTLRRQLQYLQANQPFNLVWSRLFYLYGDGQSENSLLPQLRKAAASGAPNFDMSGGEQLRDYLPVQEVARRIVALSLKGENIGLVNLCSGHPISVRKLVEGWIRENGWSIQLNLGHYPYPDYEPLAFWGDNRKLHKLLEAD